MIRENFVKNKLESGETVIGTWCIIPSAITAEIIARSGVDFIIIDNEHGPISFETAQQMIMSCELNGVSPLYRPPGVDENDILKSLDIGAHGIQVPNVDNPSQLKDIIAYSKFPPKGKRGFSPFVRAAGYTNKNSAEYYSKANDNVLVGINLEGKEAIERVDEFLEFDELDIIFIGLFDLSKALGIPGDVENPILLKEVESLTKKIKKKGKHVGTITTSLESIQRFTDFGMNFIVHYVDCEVLRTAYETPVQYLKNIK